MKRIMIVGQPGSGKSWLARAIGARTGLPVHHMDMIHWKDGWVERPRAEKIAMAHAVESGEAWVFEGGLSSTYAHRLERADMLIVLDLPLWRRLWRVVTRTLKQWGRSRPDLPDGCPEQFDPAFYRYIWRTRHSARLRNARLAKEAAGHTPAHVLRSPAAVARFLKDLEAGSL